MDDYLLKRIFYHYHIYIAVELLGKELQNFELVVADYEWLRLMVIFEWMRYFVNEMI
jgi:hypothetical protein